ncbi:MAG: glycerate kinase [Lachnospiraceae bacterium]|nr:glycerate kinase [Lachnospiraceae bacterium]
MKVVIAMDSFKGSMSSMEAGRAARDGVLRAKNAEVVVRPLADGGEGTTEALVEGLGGTYVETEVHGPMGGWVTARYGILGDGSTAVIEMAEAAGIVLVEAGRLDPWHASTTGVGEMILDAIHRGCREFIIGIGGSATVDCGIGMLQALGYEFYDREGQLLPPLPASLGDIVRIDDRGVLPELEDCCFHIACDVSNPLCGENGAVYVYGSQKGVRREECKSLDEDFLHFAEKTMEFRKKIKKRETEENVSKGNVSDGNVSDGNVLDENISSENISDGNVLNENVSDRNSSDGEKMNSGRSVERDVAETPGAGAAGGLGFACISYLPHVELKSGVSIVLDAIRLGEKLSDADIFLTGEGQLDGQTAMGKAPIGAARLAKSYGCRVIAFAGSVAEEASSCNAEGMDAFFPIVRGVTTLAEAIEPDRAKKNMMLSVEQVFRLL